MRIFPRMFLAIMSCLALVAHAQESASWQRPILPDSAMYYELGRGGTGLNVDVDPNGYIFATFYTYDQEGNPIFYAMQGYFQPSDDVSYSLGTFDAALYLSRDGECLGDGCDYQSPGRIPTDLEAHIEWESARQANLTIGTQSWDLQAAQYTVAEVDMVAGTWAATFTDRAVADGGGPGAKVFILRVTQIMEELEHQSGVAFEVTCAKAGDSLGNLATECPELYNHLARNSYGSADGYWLLYGYGGATLAPYELDDNGDRYFLDSRSQMSIYALAFTPGVMRGREVLRDDTGGGETGQRAIDMIRIPDGAVLVSSEPTAE